MSANLAPLKGVVVVDLTRVLAGPYCTMLLADLGARVIKVEHPEGGDDARMIGPFLKGQSAYYAAFNRGKQSVALDLKNPAHKKAFHKLLAQADVLVENFSYGTMERLGLGSASLKKKYPRLIYASISGFGHSGTMKTMPAYDIIAQALGGMMSITGTATKQVRVGASIGDVGAALFSAIGILAALYGRAKHNKGDKLDVAMLDCQVAMLENAVARYFVANKSPKPLGSRHSTITPFDSFKTADRPIVLAAANERVFQRMCDALGNPESLQDKRFAHNKLRTRYHSLLKRRIEAILVGGSAKSWVNKFKRHNVPSALVQSVGESVQMPQLKTRKMIVKTKGTPSFHLAGNPIKLGLLPDSATRAKPPKLGEHNNLVK